MPVFMQREHVQPGNRTQVQAILKRRQIKLAAPGCQSHVGVRDQRPGLQEDIDAPHLIAQGGRIFGSHLMGDP